MRGGAAMLWHCARCTAAYSAGAPRCPHCGSTDRTEDGEMPKATSAGASNARESQPDAGQEQEFAGYGEEMHAVEAPADGTMSPEITSDGIGSPPPPAQDESAGALPPPPPPESP